MQLPLHHHAPEFAGFNTKLSGEQGHAVKPATKAVYTPLIDMVTFDPTTMMTAMIEAQDPTSQSGQNFTIFHSRPTAISCEMANEILSMGVS